MKFWNVNLMHGMAYVQPISPAEYNQFKRDCEADKSLYVESISVDRDTTILLVAAPDPIGIPQREYAERVVKNYDPHNPVIYP